MKQIEYTEKQKTVIEILEKVVALFKGDYDYVPYQAEKFYGRIKKIKNEYGIKDKLLTLREYLKAHQCGAYHNFIFNIHLTKINVSNINEFERVYQPKLLDNYYVINDNSKSNNGNCENYRCDHYLTLEPKED